MDFLKNNKKIYSVMPYIIVTLLLLTTIWLLSQVTFIADAFSTFWNVISPFVAAFVIAYIFDMPCTAIQNLLLRSTKREFIKKRSRLISSLILLCILIVLTAALLNFVIPIIYKNIMLLIEELPTFRESIEMFSEWIQDLQIPQFVPEIPTFDEIVEALQPLMTNFEGVFGAIFSGAFGAFGALFRVFLTVVATIYFVIEKDNIKEFSQKLIASLFNIKITNFILDYSKKLDFNFRQYIYTQTIDGLILGTLMTIALFFIGSPFALLLGIMLGVVNYIPYFGSIFGTIVAVLVVSLTQNVQTALIAAAIMFIIQQLDANVIQPKLMSDSFSISPLLVIISVTIGSAYAGVIGMLVAIPLACLFKDIIDEFIEKRTTKIKEEELTYERK